MVYYPPLGVVYTGPTSSNATFPGLIPGLAGSLPGHPSLLPVKPREQPKVLSVAPKSGRNRASEQLKVRSAEHAALMEQFRQLHELLSEAEGGDTSYVQFMEGRIRGHPSDCLRLYELKTTVYKLT